MGFLIVVGVILCCYYSGKSEQRKKQAVRDDSIQVICPYCNGRVRIASEGEWICPHCDKEFTYYGNQSRQKSNDHRDNEIHLKCPYCNDNVVVRSEGTWNCPYCSKTFIYRGQKVYESEEACNDSVILIITLLAKLSKADGVVTKKEISLLRNILDSELEINLQQKKEVQEILTPALSP